SLDRKIVIAIALLLLVSVLVPVLNLMTGPTNPLHVPTYIMSLFGKYLTYALLALAMTILRSSDRRRKAVIMLPPPF
ncbi:hypothetical protein ACCT11_36780, partial [Rhizobium johnstonii]